LAPSVLAASAEYRYDRPRDDTSHDARAGSTRAFDDRSEAGEALHLECLRKRSGRSVPAAANWQSVGHRACRSPAVGVARNLSQRARISAPRRSDAEVRNGASGTTFCRDRLTITVDNIAFREARERDSLAARYLPGCVAASLPNAKSSSITGSRRIRSTNDISRCCRQPQSSAAPIPSGPTRTIDHVARSQSSSHSFVRSERAPFLCSGQELQRHRARRRSRMVTKPARQRFTIDAREHDGRLATSRDGDVHRCDPGRIDAVGRCSARRQGSSTTRRPNGLTVHPFATFVIEASRRFCVPEHWIRAVMRVESDGKQ
jgi:hypothetical protein